MTTHRIEHAACCCQDTLDKLEDTIGERDRARDLAARLEAQLARVQARADSLYALAGSLRGTFPVSAAVLDGATLRLQAILDAENGAIVPVDPRLTDQIRAHGGRVDSGANPPENAATGRCCAGDGIPEAGAVCDRHQDRR